LKYNINEVFEGKPFAIIGNFPYNISTQIVFRCLELRHQVPEFSGMFQKEVAERICSKKGSKVYGILSVLVQAFYNAEYLFTVDEHVFNPPPKIKSGVLRLRRKENFHLPCNEKMFFSVVKTGFQQRRKTLRNSLKSFGLSDNLKEDTIFDLRPEQLSVEQFIELTQKIEANAV
jgi:16S rRNA (adenine1518-N6/adenine1519-N6)-dimethyltransferase